VTTYSQTTHPIYTTDSNDEVEEQLSICINLYAGWRAFN